MTQQIKQQISAQTLNAPLSPTAETIQMSKTAAIELPPPTLVTEQLAKAFFGIPAVRGVSIMVQPGEIVGLIGQNGAGKSTLMNLIGGVVQPDSGTMQFQGKPYAPRSPADATAVGIAFIHQELNLFTNLSIAENLFIDNFPRRGPLRLLDRASMRRRTAELLAQVQLDLPPDMQVDRMSPGERQLVEIAKALYRDAPLIIFDEPTTSLTARETEQLFRLMNRLREQGKAMIYISHILNDVMALADSVAVMRDGQLVTQEAKSAFNVQRMIRLMVGRNLEQLYPPRTAPQSENREPLLQVEGVSARGVVENISLTVHRGEIVGMFGLMGSGRTELARIIYGLDGHDSGTIRVGDATHDKPSPRRSIARHIAFVTENRREEGLLMNLEISSNITLVALPEFARTFAQVLDEGAMEDSARAAASTLQLKSGDITRQPAKALSGGNQQKVVIAKWLLAQPTVFIMDEPTRGIDVGAKYEIYSIMDRLAAAGSGVLFISSELEELMGLCDRIVVLSRGELVAEFPREQFETEAILRAAFREMGVIGADAPVNQEREAAGAATDAEADSSVAQGMAEDEDKAKREEVAS